MFTIKECEDKFEIYELRDEEANAYVRVCPERGGIITNFSVKGNEIFYLDKETFYDVEKNIRGGNPILFPLCGQLPNKKYSLDGTEYQMKNHGLARINKWKVIDKNTEGSAKIKISMKSDKETIKSFPFNFNVEFEYILKGNKLIINQRYENKSERKMPIAVGFHPYFYAENKSLIKYDVNASECFDNEDHLIKKCIPEKIDLTNSKELKLLLDNKGNSISFYEADLNRKITLDYSDEFKYIVLWSTPESKFVCVEPWTSKIGALHSKEDLLEISPKEELKLTFSIEVQ